MVTTPMHQEQESAARPRPARWSRSLVALSLGIGLGGCASVEFTRETETSGRFTSTGTAMTLFGWDFPGRAVQIALDNASDARQPNTEITDQRIFPYLGPLDWLLDIFSVRYARISGTWGFAPGSGSTFLPPPAAPALPLPPQASPELSPDPPGPPPDAVPGGQP